MQSTFPRIQPSLAATWFELAPPHRALKYSAKPTHVAANAAEYGPSIFPHPLQSRGNPTPRSLSTGSVYHFLPAVQQVLDAYRLIFIVGQQTHIYADPDSTVILGVTRTGSGGTASANISVSGYLVDVR